MSGSIPAALGGLANLRELLLADNPLSGALPSTLTGLGNLEYLYLDDTQLCAPTDAAFQAWLGSIGNKRGVVNCEAPLVSDRAALVALYHATDGPNWTNNTHWLSDRPLGEWDGVRTDDEGRVIELDLRDNALRGTIPAELGNLANLERLSLFDNQLSGSIPSQLGGLTKLIWLRLYNNQLRGTIPAELGNLTNLERLVLYNNQLSGTIPAELGNLAKLERLLLSGNQLRGTIPAELGRLANLRDLYLDNNQLSGTIPAELGRLTNLRELLLADNPLSGALPGTLTGLGNLEYLYLSDTQVCAPTDAAFQAWLEGIGTKRGVANCEETLVSDRDALVALYNATDGPNMDQQDPLAERSAAGRVVWGENR